MVSASGTGGKVTLLRDGREITSLEGSGEMIDSHYLSRFEAACTSRDRAVEKISYASFESAVAEGIASIEGFLNEMADRWNQIHPEDPLHDSSTAKVSLDEKIATWIPKVSAGRKQDRGDVRWSHFAELRAIRDDHAMHPKILAHAISEGALAERLTAFEPGWRGCLGHFTPPLAFGFPRRS